MVVFPFPDALAGFRDLILAVWTGEPLFSGRRAPAWGFLRGWREITKVESRAKGENMADLVKTEVVSVNCPYCHNNKVVKNGT